LGLALVQNLVALHGGTTQAFSDGPGTGSRFVVRLPISTEAIPRTVVDETPLKSQDIEQKRVLIVDDNRDAAEVIAELLRMDGHDVRVAFEARSGLEVADQFRPEVIFLDIGLPGMDGHELALRLRARFHAEDCKLIALSGYGQADDIARGTSSGFAKYLVKPVDLDAIRAAIAATTGS
jgi:CheY-like chemotaxis protein